MTFEVAIPDASLEDCASLRDKTVKVGLLARAFAIFKVERVFIYSTPQSEESHNRDAALLVRLLRFMDTPQYLRKQVFAHTPSLKYAGILPPLRIKSHPLAAKTTDLMEGDIRWGIQTQKGMIDLGLDKSVKCDEQVNRHTPAIFRVKSSKPLRLEIIEREDIEYYFGFEVERVDNLQKTLEQSGSSTRIVFSRNGVQFNQIADKIQSTVRGNGSVLALFGSPKSGIRDLFRNSMDTIKPNIEFWINTIHDQGTETVRLEEAVFSSLGLLNDRLGVLYSKSGYHS